MAPNWPIAAGLAESRRTAARVSGGAISLSAPAGVDPDIAAVAPSQLLQGLLERRQLDLAAWIVRGPVHEHTEPPHPLGLLRACRNRPRHCRAAKERYEYAASHVLPLRSEDHTTTSLKKNRVVHRRKIRRLMSVAGHFRQIDPLPTLSACPLRPDRVRTFAPQRFDAVCHNRTHAVQPAASTMAATYSITSVGTQQ
jgi:hypothetical protein